MIVLDDGTKRKAFARCENCGTEVAAMRRVDGSLVTPHGDCQECGTTEFEEVDPEELNELSKHADWARETADGAGRTESAVPEATE